MQTQITPSTRLALHFSLSVALLSSLCSCRQGSKARTCEPSVQQGCPDGQRCALSEQGSPSCLPSNPEGLGEGRLCERSEECADGLGCVRALGIPQCVRFCSLDQSQEAADAQCAAGSLYAQCLGALPERVDIGVCLTPCDPLPSSPDMRSCVGEELSCGLNLDLPFLTCGRVGAQRVGEPCDPSLRCASELLCFSEGQARRCLPFAEPERPCPEGTLRRAELGRYDPHTGGAISACWPSLSLPQTVMRATSYRLSLEARGSWSAREELCRSWGGEVAELSAEGLALSLSDPLTRLLDERAASLSRAAEPYEVWVSSGEEHEGSCLALVGERPQEDGALSWSLSERSCELALPTICQFERDNELP